MLDSSGIKNSRQVLIHPDEALYEQLSDLGNAERLVRQYRGSIRYCYARARWLLWTGTHWAWDDGNGISLKAQLAVRDIYRQAADEPEEKIRKDLVSHALKSESEHRLNAMVNLAESQPDIPVTIAELDRDPWLFNCLNGTLNLKTGELLPHRREDLLTIVVPLDYDPGVPCPLWLKFMDRVTAGNPELQSYLQRAVGYSLTGVTKNQCFFFLYGLGTNGKSTFTMTIRKLIAGYGDRLDADDLMLKDRKAGGGPKEGVAGLKGKRFVVASELQDGRRFDVSLVKDMTGGETLKARRLYEHEAEFYPTHKLWLFGNHRPVVGDTTLSIWRRVRLIPFTVTISPNEIDPDLPAKLEGELPGILAWAVRGCLDWQQGGLMEPETVTTATVEYQREQDILGEFLEDCCRLEPLGLVSKADLRDCYSEWCTDNKVEPVGQRTFKARLIEKGITEAKSGPTRYWKGLSLVPQGTTSTPALGTNGTSCKDLPESPLIKEKQNNFTENRYKLSQLSQDLAPAYPTDPCPTCGSPEYHLTGDNRWACRRCQLIELGTKLGYPRLELGPGVALERGKEAWRRFAGKASAGELAGAVRIAKGAS